MATSRLSDLLQKEQPQLLESWLREQLGSQNLRADLLSERELQSESTRFLKLLAQATQSGDTDIHSESFAPLLEMLRSLTRSRSQQGFSPSETALFVFSVKQPLMEALRKELGDSMDTLNESWAANLLLDRLGLFTMETYQTSREEVIRRQQEEMMELSTPVVQLWNGIVALPLIGTLDSARTSVVMETLLQAIVRTRSEIAIIDITGVPTVDTLVAQHLLKTVAAARLMGADCIISGIRPQIAQTMVHLQIDLSAVMTKATMAEALATALKRTGYALSRVTPKSISTR